MSVSHGEKPNNKILGSLEIPSKMTTTTSTSDSKTKMYSFMVIFTASTSLATSSLYTFTMHLCSFPFTQLFFKCLKMTQHYPANWLKNVLNWQKKWVDGVFKDLLLLWGQSSKAPSMIKSTYQIVYIGKFLKIFLE